MSQSAIWDKLYLRVATQVGEAVNENCLKIGNKFIKWDYFYNLFYLTCIIVVNITPE